MQDNFENEVVLWDCFRKGNRLAYAYLYKKYIYLLLSYGMQLTPDRELVKDCAQEVFIRLYTYKETIKPEQIKVYLLVCMKNRVKEQLTLQQLHDEKIVYYGESIESETLSSEETFIIEESSNHLKETIKTILSQLSPHQKEIIHYRYIDELSMEQISQLMNMNIQSAYNLLHRSIKKIREIIKKDLHK